MFTELDIKSRMWSTIKDLYTDVKARVLYSGSLSRSFDTSQGTGQGITLGSFMYKVYINSLLRVLTDHCYLICINNSTLASTFSADDISLIALHPSFLTTFMNIDMNTDLLRDTNQPILKVVLSHELSADIVEKLYEYKKLGVLKNCINRFLLM